MSDYLALRGQLSALDRQIAGLEADRAELIAKLESVCHHQTSEGESTVVAVDDLRTGVWYRCAICERETRYGDLKRLYDRACSR